MNKFKRLLLIPILLLTLALPLVLSSCAMDYKVSEIASENLVKKAKSVDAGSGTGKYAVDSSVTTVWSPKTAGGDWLEIIFKKDVTFNTVTIKEKSSAVKIFKLQIPEGDGWQTIYYSDGIGSYRLCAFDQVTTSRLRFVVDNAFDKFSIRELAVYNIENQPIESMKKTAFISVSTYADMLANRPAELDEYLAFYNDIVITDAVSANAQGNLDLAVTTQALKDIISSITAHTAVKASINITNNAAVNPINTNQSCDNVTAKLLELLVNTGANGLTLQWKEMVGAEIWRAYNVVIGNLSARLTSDYSADVKPSLSILLDNARAGLESKTCKKLDRVYFFGAPATDYTDVYNDFYNNCYFAVNLLSTLGFNKSQIVLTIPLFAHSVSNHSGLMPYSQLAATVNNVNQWQNLYISVKNGDSYRDYYFQSVELSSDKAFYAKELRLGGFGVVELSYDLPMSNSLSITSAIAKVLR